MITELEPLFFKFRCSGTKIAHSFTELREIVEKIFPRHIMGELMLDYYVVLYNDELRFRMPMHYLHDYSMIEQVLLDVIVSHWSIPVEDILEMITAVNK